MTEHHVVHHECCYHPANTCGVDMSEHVAGFSIMTCCHCHASVDIDPWEMADETELTLERHNGKKVA